MTAATPALAATPMTAATPVTRHRYDRPVHRGCHLVLQPQSLPLCP